MTDMIFSIGTLISLLILAYGAYLSIAYSYTSETGREHDEPEASNVINLGEASRNGSTDFTIGFRDNPAPTERKPARVTRRLKAELPKMLAEHKQIVGALEKLRAAAHAAGRAEYVRFADALVLHAQTEEQVALADGDHGEVDLDGGRVTP